MAYLNGNNENKSGYNSGLNFAEMPAQTGFYDATSYAAGSNVAGGYATATVNQAYYQDWSNQPQYFAPQTLQHSNMDPFVPVQPNVKSNADDYGVNYENEPPLLEELGINFEHIYRKTKCVLNPFAKPHETIIHDEDMAGPLVFCIAYGFSLLLMGKIQFGYIYGITALGCLCMYTLLNLMSEQGVSAVCIGSTLGYCLLPMVILLFLSCFVTLNGLVGLVLSVVFILWCSISSSKLFVFALDMSNQQLLVLYPCFLLYGIFGLLNVF
jgi:hypothetical protein